jgi:hypothetical protein
VPPRTPPETTLAVTCIPALAPAKAVPTPPEAAPITPFTITSFAKLFPSNSSLSFLAY